MMPSLSEQRAAVKFCSLLGKNAAETVLMLKTAYKDDVYKWFAWFKNGDMSIDDKSRCGRSSTVRIDENVEKIEILCLQTVDRQLINRQ